MKSYPIAIASVFLIFLACRKKEDVLQYSYWYVNNDSFSSNEVFVDRGKARTDMETNSLNNGFGLTFYLDYLPHSGAFSITNTTVQHPNYVGVGIHYGNQYYNVAQDLRTNMIAIESNGKSSYKLTNTWFKNYENASDSILVHGTFNEP